MLQCFMFSLATLQSTNPYSKVGLFCGVAVDRILERLLAGAMHLHIALRHKKMKQDARTWARQSGSARVLSMTQRCPLFAEIWHNTLANMPVLWTMQLFRFVSGQRVVLSDIQHNNFFLFSLNTSDSVIFCQQETCGRCQGMHRVFEYAPITQAETWFIQ